MPKAPATAEEARRGAVWVATKLREAGHEGWLVGGCVRDRLLGRPVREYDIATSATPDQVQSVFRRTVPVGVDFGVIMVLAPEGPYEVATFRTDGDYSDGRRPDAVQFTNAEEDVKRRDFTINGLLEDPLTGEVTDYVKGRRDLAARVVRAIGDPEARFREDHLRILRAIRFAATLGFDIESATFNAILPLAPRVQEVSVERIHTELARMFTEGDPARAYTLLALTRVLDAVLPEAAWLGSNVAARLQALGDVPFPVHLAALLGDASAQQGSAVAERLRTSRADRELVAYLLDARTGFELDRNRADTIRFVRDERWPLAARLARAERLARGQDTGVVERLVQLRESLTPDELHPPRLLDGNDLRAMGLKPGRHFKTLLDALETAQLNGRVKTREDAERLIGELSAD